MLPFCHEWLFSSISCYFIRDLQKHMTAFSFRDQWPVKIGGIQE